MSNFSALYFIYIFFSIYKTRTNVHLRTKISEQKLYPIVSTPYKCFEKPFLIARFLDIHIENTQKKISM